MAMGLLVLQSLQTQRYPATTTRAGGMSAHKRIESIWQIGGYK